VPTAAKKPKSIPPQADVRIVGGNTTVALRAYGRATLERMSALLAELHDNAKTDKMLFVSVHNVANEMTALCGELHCVPEFIRECDESVPAGTLRDNMDNCDADD